MPYVFSSPPTKTLRGKLSNLKPFSLDGIDDNENMTPQQVAAQANKLFAIGGLSVVVNKTLKRIETEEAFNEEW